VIDRIVGYRRIPDTADFSRTVFELTLAAFDFFPTYHEGHDQNDIREYSNWVFMYRNIEG